MTEEVTFETVTEKVIDGLAREFKDHEKAPKNENLLKTICRYALKISDIYELLDEKDNIRKINVKNYMIFYTIDENKCLVQVIAVFYGMSNWQTKIKRRIVN